MALHKQALGVGDVEVIPGTGTALGTGVHEQHGSRPGQGPSQGGLADSVLLVDDCDDPHCVAPARLNQHHIIT